LTKQATQEKWKYEKYLSEVLKIEESGRRKRRVERYERLSGLPSFKRFDSFNQEELAPDIQMKINTLRRGDFINRYENILLFGQPGTGKTHLASAFGHELIRQGKKVYFSLCSTLVQELLRAKATFSLPRKLKQLSRYDLIIIDEIGYIQQSRDEMEILFSMFSDSLPITSAMRKRNQKQSLNHNQNQNLFPLHHLMQIKMAFLMHKITVQ